MFCSKCGNKLDNDALFCNKCGSKLNKDVLPPKTNIDKEPVVLQEHPELLQTATLSNDLEDFKTFVDNHIQKTTKFKTADDLINNSKPLKFIWFCIGIPALLGLLLGFSGSLMSALGFLLIFGGFFGYVATFIASGIIRMRYKSSFSGEFIGNINIEELLIFLSKHLKHIHPYFHEWGYLTTSGLSSILENAIVSATKEVRLCSGFGLKKKHLVALYIKPKDADKNPGENLYFVDAMKNGFLMDGRAAGFLGHGTLIRTAPILQAAMEYYLKAKTS